MRSTTVYLLAWLAAITPHTAATSEWQARPGNSDQSEVSRGAQPEKRLVVRVLDGDTIVVNPNEKVRLIGIDAPETAHPQKALQCFGKNAKEFTREMVERRSVGLIFDPFNAARNHKDRYGRTLAYVYTDSGTMLNAELLRRGYARAYTRFPFRYKVQFRELERIARNEHAGLWSNCLSR